MNGSPQHLNLLVLAAGMGSRYGGLKQLESFGSSGETLMEFSLRNAREAGFERFVFVIRRDFADSFQAGVLQRLPEGIEFDTVFQEIDTLPTGLRPPPGRTKPWGTGHALWVAREALSGPFAVINADDFYGRDALTRLAGFLRAPETEPPAAVVAFRLDQTLSDHGGVSRGIICTEGSTLLGLHEYHNLRAEGEGVVGLPSGGSDEVYLERDTPVSLNLFGFRGGALAGIDGEIRRFFDQEIASPKSEYYLPTFVESLRASGRDVAVVRSDDEWLGVTFPEDRDRVRQRIAEIQKGNAD